MQLVQAEFAGVCFGVERALRLADEALAQGKPIVSYGPLIHNSLVVEDFASRGLQVEKDLASCVADPGRSVLIRSHGVGPEELALLKASGLPLVDTTCPYVLRAQRAASDLGKQYHTVIIVGESGHPEVEALRAYVRETGAIALVVLAPEELPEDLPTAVGVVVQTTQRKAVLDAVSGALAAKDIAVELCDTICNATQERQDAALKLATQVDAMVVVGGKHSSNTTRLAEICQSVCSRVYHIESPNELYPGMFTGCETVGLTAGASTPAAQISAVYSLLSGF